MPTSYRSFYTACKVEILTAIPKQLEGWARALEIVGRRLVSAYGVRRQSAATPPLWNFGRVGQSKAASSLRSAAALHKLPDAPPG